jgi:hypothetical protein
VSFTGFLTSEAENPAEIAIRKIRSPTRSLRMRQEGHTHFKKTE